MSSACLAEVVAGLSGILAARNAGDSHGQSEGLFGPARVTMEGYSSEKERQTERLLLLLLHRSQPDCGRA